MFSLILYTWRKKDKWFGQWPFPVSEKVHSMTSHDKQLQSAFSSGILPLGAQTFFLAKLAVLSRFLYGRWYSCFCVKNMLLACLPLTWSMRWWSDEPPWLLFTVLCLVQGFLKWTNVLVSLPIWRQRCVCMCICTPMCACSYAHPAWARATAIPRAAPSEAVSGNLLSAQSRSAGPAQLLCMLSTKQISLEGGKKIEGSICSFLLHCADARLR